MSFNFGSFQIRLDKALEHVRTDLATLRTGRASAQLLDPVRVEAYGSNMRINEVANVSAPDPSSIVVSVWDKSLMETVEKAIASSGLNLHPVVASGVIRINIPPLTQERRMEMVKLLGQKIEQGKVMVRNIRTDAKKEIEDQEGTEGISEDDVKLDLSEMEQMYKKTLETLDKMTQDKEKELMTV